MVARIAAGTSGSGQGALWQLRPSLRQRHVRDQRIKIDHRHFPWASAIPRNAFKRTALAAVAAAFAPPTLGGKREELIVKIDVGGELRQTLPFLGELPRGRPSLRPVVANAYSSAVASLAVGAGLGPRHVALCLESRRSRP